MPRKLYGYFRSSAAYRVRIALELKRLSWQSESIHLTKDGGKQYSAPYQSINPLSLVPTLKDNNAHHTQSLAIIEYLEELYPEPSLLPKNPIARARVRAIALSIACDIHPLNNLRILKYLTNILTVSDTARMEWYAHWLSKGFEAIEVMLAGHRDTGSFCHGDTPGLADICLVPQVFNANRFDCDLTRFPTILRINEKCMALDAFQKAQPANQPDAE